jgi:protoheme IX farnesyltransferase
MAIETALKVPLWRDYLSLAKPRVIMLHLLTAAAAMFLAGKGLPPLALFLSTLVGGGLVAGASNALNCCLDIDLDRSMSRTRLRPLPAARLRPFQAWLLAAFLGGGGLLVLSLLVSWTTAFLALAALAYYILVYTLWLKRRTYWSSILGSGAGAFPPLIGWMAVTGRIEFTPFFLFGLVVLWTLPHFWSLVIYRKDDYQGAGLGLLPRTHAELWILMSAVGLVALSLVTSRVASLGWIYLAAALALGVSLLVLAWQLWLKPTRDSARRLYRFSLLYLLVLFSAMLIDKFLLL